MEDTDTDPQRRDLPPPGTQNKGPSGPSGDAEDEFWRPRRRSQENPEHFQGAGFMGGPGQFPPFQRFPPPQWSPWYGPPQQSYGPPQQSFPSGLPQQYGFSGPSQQMNTPLPQTFSQPTVQTDPAAAAGSMKQMIKDTFKEFMQSGDTKKVVTRKRKGGEQSSSEVAKKPCVEECSSEEDSAEDSSEETEDLILMNERVQSEGEDSEMEEIPVEESAVDFKAKLLFVEKTLEHRGVKTKTYLPESKFSCSMSIMSDDLSSPKSRKEKIQLVCPAIHNNAFDTFHARRRGDPQPEINAGPKPSMKEGILPKWPLFSESSYRMAEAKLSTEPPQLNEALLGQKSSRESSVRSSGSNVLKFEPKTYEINKREFSSWEGASRKMVHSLGFVDMLNTTVNTVLSNASESKDGEFRLLSVADFDMIKNLMRSSQIAVAQTCSTTLHHALSLTTLRREQIVGRVNRNLQDARTEQLRLSPEENGYLFPRDAVNSAIGDLKELDRYGASSGGGGRFNSKATSAGSSSSGKKKGGGGQSNDSFRGNTGGNTSSKDYTSNKKDNSNYTNNNTSSYQKPQYSKGGGGGGKPKGGGGKKKSGGKKQ